MILLEFMALRIECLLVFFLLSQSINGFAVSQSASSADVSSSSEFDSVGASSSRAC